MMGQSQFLGNFEIVRNIFGYFRKSSEKVGESSENYPGAPWMVKNFISATQKKLVGFASGAVPVLHLLFV